MIVFSATSRVPARRELFTTNVYSVWRRPLDSEPPPTHKGLAQGHNVLSWHVARAVGTGARATEGGPGTRLTSYP